MREFIRHPTDIPIEFQPSGASWETHEALSNVSMGGLAFHARAAVDVGAIVRVRIPVDQPPYEAEARVAWCLPTGNEYYDVGVELLHAEDNFRSRMIEQVCHIEHYKREVLRNEGRALTGEQAAREWIEKFADSFPAMGESSPTAPSH